MLREAFPAKGGGGEAQVKLRSLSFSIELNLDAFFGVYYKRMMILVEHQCQLLRDRRSARHHRQLLVIAWGSS